MYLILLASLAAHAAPADGVVTVDGETWARLVRVDKEDPGEGHGPAAVAREVRLRWDGEVVHVTARWRVEAQEAGWWRARLAGPGVLVQRVTWNGARPSTSSDASGTWVTGRVRGPVELVLYGTLAQDPTRGAARVELAPASIGTVLVDAGKLEGTLSGADVVPVDGSWWTSSPDLKLTVAPKRRAARDRRTLAVAASGIGLTVGEGELRGKARLQWTLRQGELKAVSFTVKDVGTDLDVVGPGVAAWSRQGDRVTVRLDKPVRDRVDLELSWSSALVASAESRVAVPVVIPGDAFRVQSSLQLAKDSELEVVPALKGWTPVAASQLQTWGTDLIEGTPTAAYELGGPGKSGSLSLLRFVPAAGPEVMVDVAAYTMTASAEGRTLTRALYTVRNERAGNLRFRPPEGYSVIGVRVAGDTAIPARTGGDWVIPLPRSVETVKGLVSFPVEVILLGRLDERWSRREIREVPLPRIGAPVAVNRVTLTLPPTWTDELEEGEHGRVDDFSEGEGIAYGFGVGGTDEAKADQLWQDAMGSYMDNDFDKADELLNQLDDMGADNENLARLRSNLDVVQGRSSGGESAMSRRVVAQAKSRGEDDRRRREQILREAEQQLEAGDYEQAERAYKKAHSLSQKLSKLEQKESVEEKEKVQYAVTNAVKAKEKREERAKNQAVYRAAQEAAPEPDVSGFVELEDERSFSFQAPPDEPEPTPEVVDEEPEEEEAIVGYDEDMEFSFEGIEVQGQLSSDGDGFGAGSATVVTGGAKGGAVGSEVVEDQPDVEAQKRVVVSADKIVVDDTKRVSEVETVQRLRAVPAAASPQRAGISLGGLRRSAGRDRNARGPRTAAKPPSPKPAKSSASGSASTPPPPPRTPSASPADSGVLGVVDGVFDASNKDRAGGDVFRSDEAFEPLEVSSTSMSVVVPVLGQTIRYQHLLLPADADVVVHVEARAPRSSIRSLQ